VADRSQPAVVVVEPEDQGADGVLLLAGAPAHHDGVDRADALDLRHADALAGAVAGVLALGDHALGPVQPRLGLLRDLGGGRQVDRRIDHALEPVAALRLRQLEQRLVVEGEQVERDEPRRRLLGEHADARLGGMDPLSQRVEVLPPIGVEQHDLAVEHVAPVGELQLREVAPHRLAAARLEVDVAPVDERQRPEAVPLRLVHPARPGGERLGGLGELREDGRLEREGHAPKPTKRNDPRRESDGGRRGRGTAVLGRYFDL
jgi:hypothetical protein